MGNLEADEASSLLNKMRDISDIVLELAATIVFLRDDWDYFGKESTSPVDETRKRKPLKSTDERISEARDLLQELGLNTVSANA